MLRILIMIISLIAVVTVNVAAYSMPLNGNSTVEIANKLPVIFTPKGYVFSIWGVIFVLLSTWLINYWRNYNKENDNIDKRRAFLFVLSCLFNCSWIFFWHYHYFNLTIFSMVALIATLIGLYFTYPKKMNLLVERVPISIYLGWIIILFISNVSYVLTLYGWNGWGLSDPLWTVIYLTVATAVALHFMYHHKDIALNVVFMWAFVGIAVKNGFEELFVSAAALFLTAVIFVCIFIFNANRKNTPNL